MNKKEKDFFGVVAHHWWVVGDSFENQLLEAIRLVKLTLKKLCDTCVVLTLREYKKYVLSNIEMSEK